MNDKDADPKTAVIQALNDSFRKRLGGKVIMSAFVSAQPDGIKDKIVALVREFRDFTEGDDPFGEHDFGAFSFDGQRYIWKIDYLDEHAARRSKDPSDPALTTRVLTIALSSEY